MLDRMRDALARVLVLPEIQEEDEELYDISRAYGLLLNTLKTLDYHPSEEENELHHPIHSEEDIQLFYLCWCSTCVGVCMQCTTMNSATMTHQSHQDCV